MPVVYSNDFYHQVDIKVTSNDWKSATATQHHGLYVAHHQCGEEKDSIDACT